MQTLSVRKTFKYVGSHSDLDEWEDIGTMDILRTDVERTDDDEDACEPMTHVHYVMVETEALSPKVHEALMNTFTKAGCAHEHDCCGCRSYHADEAVWLGGPLWKVIVNSSRNY